MATVWDDVAGASNNIIDTNNLQTFRFNWVFVSFTGETQDEAEVRWRKAGASMTIRERMKFEDTIWTNASIKVGRWEDMTTWTLSGGQLVPPIAANRRYSNISFIDLPEGTLTDGVYIFQIRMRPTDSVDWSGWFTHRVEISQYADQQTFLGTATGVTKGPAFPNEGNYGMKVEVMSSVGITAESAEVTFDVWDTTKYIYNGVTTEAVPENYHNGTVVGRVKRS